MVLKSKAEIEYLTTKCEYLLAKLNYHIFKALEPVYIKRNKPLDEGKDPTDV